MKKLVVISILFIISEHLFSQVISLREVSSVERLCKNKFQKAASLLFWLTTITRLSPIRSEEANFKDPPRDIQGRLSTAAVHVPLSIPFSTNKHKAICLSVKKEKAFVPGKGSLGQRSFAALSLKFPIHN